MAYTDGPLRLDQHLRSSLMWTKAEIEASLDQGRVTLRTGEGENKIMKEAYHMVFPPDDTVLLDGLAVPPWDHSQCCVYAINKPRGMNVTMTKLKMQSSKSSHHQRKLCLATWLEEMQQEQDSLDPLPTSSYLQLPASTRLHYIGRLDKATTGLLLATNDGSLTTLLCTPGMVQKEYIATVHARPTEEQLQCLRDGLHLPDGFARVDEVEVVNTGVYSSTYDATTREKPCADIRLQVSIGRFRIVRRLLAAVGLPVQHLHRSCIGPIRLCQPGQSNSNDAGQGMTVTLEKNCHVKLSQQQVGALWRAGGGKEMIRKVKAEGLRAKVKELEAAGQAPGSPPTERVKAWLAAAGYGS